MRRIRVLVVDDSAVVRKLLTDAVTSSPDFELAGSAGNGQAALERLDAAAPDVVTLDVEMPVLDGIATLKQLRLRRPRLPVLMLSSHTERGALATLDALAAGASDFVTKPVLSGLAEAQAFMEREVLGRLRGLAGRPASPGVAAPSRLPPTASPPVAAARPRAPGMPPRRLEAIVIGISTGGPPALAQLIPALPASLPVPILVVQHMPPLFTRVLADRLSSLGPLKVTEATDGAPALAGHVHLAPGGRHLVVERGLAGPVLRLNDGPPESSCRPAADPLFRSAAELWGDALLAVVMTGMGSDGRAGAERIRARGGSIIVQDKESSVVWGMPGAVADAGLADAILPLAALAGEITARLGIGRAMFHAERRP